MNKDIHLDHFSGPLDLLLQLIEQKEMDITTVSITSVTEQFLSHLDEVEDRNPEELADFLVMATRLLLLKSHALLPYLYLEEEPDSGQLAAQLRMYKAYVDAMGGLEQLIARHEYLHPRQSVAPQEVVFRAPESVGVKELKQFFVEVLERLEPVVKIPKTAMQKVLSLREKLCQIEELIESQVKLRFKELLADSDDREEVVVTFLALLELVKKQAVCISQEKLFSDITIEKAK